ncbi:MAG: bifunctional 5,10-methylenetetrahydrofolate dehydrogenase/5,10-methenyltetrahydrofolate cyclohydrolase [Erysipelotrichaceae bacterium]|nr:bifunctional 5,10-methylenetetrahydrofolate dehydrogenase/5,10-methenyltetrahydrofolate cyclohydrolase [Erysipelotrichaceae bacterium]
MSELLKGKPVAEAIRERCINKMKDLSGKGITPTLALFRVGEKQDDLSYEKGIGKCFDKIGIAIKKYVFDVNADPEGLYRALKDANDDENIHGILVFRPLPKSFDEEKVKALIDPEKDVDGCNDLSLAGIFMNKDLGFAPCTAQAVTEILHHYRIEVSGKKAVVLGRSLVIGKPVSMLLLNEDATVTVCHSRTKDIEAIASDADILICATGKTSSIGSSYFNDRQTLIDVGIGFDPIRNKLCGDVIFEEADGIVQAVTPVPGGVGSVTTAVLASHVIEAALKR